MPIGKPSAGGGEASVVGCRNVFCIPSQENSINITDALFYPAYGGFVLARQNAGRVYFAPSLIGPYDSVLSGANVSAFAKLALFNDRIYMVGRGSAVANTVRSSDATLTAFTNEFGGLTINDVAYNNDKIILATNYDAAPRNGIIYTGTSWDNIFAGNTVNALSCTITATGRILFGFANGIIRYSDNDGGAWTEVNLGVASNVSLLYVDADNNVFAALANGRIFESTGNGSAFVDGFPAISSGITLTPVAFSGIENVRLYCNSGAAIERIAPLTWRAVPSPQTSNYLGALRNNEIKAGFLAGNLISDL